MLPNKVTSMPAGKDYHKISFLGYPALFPANRFSTKGKQANQRSCFKNYDIKLATVAHTYNTFTWEAEAGGLLWVCDQLGLQVRLSQKTKNKNKNKQTITMLPWCQGLLDYQLYQLTSFLEWPCGEVTSRCHRNGHCLASRERFCMISFMTVYAFLLNPLALPTY